MLRACVCASDADYATTGDLMLAVFGATTTAMVATTQEMDYLSRLVRRASNWADAFVGQPLGLQVYSETLPAAGDRLLRLSRVPVVKVLRFFDSTATSEATAICSTDYLLENLDAGLLARDAGFRWTAAMMDAETPFSLGLTRSYLPGWNGRPWLVEYAAGYRLAASTTTCFGVSTADEAWTTGATLPQDVVQAVVSRAVGMYQNPTGVFSRRVGDLAVQYASAGPAGAESPSEPERLLAPYRRLF